MKPSKLSRIRGSKMGTPGVKVAQLFLEYMHPWSPVFMLDPMPGWLPGDLLKNIPLVTNLTDKLLFSVYPSGTHFTPTGPII